MLDSVTSHLFVKPRFMQCHGSTLSLFPDGSLAAAWFAGTREGCPDTAIWYCRQQGDKWTRPEMIAKCYAVPHWNPVLFPNGDGNMTLYFKTGKSPESWNTWKFRINHNGEALSRPRVLKSKEVEAGRMTMGPVRGKIVQTSSGALIAPSSIEKVIARRLVGYHIQRDVRWESVIHRSSNGGKTWHPVMVPYARKEGELGGIIQPSVWEMSPGRLAALFRSTNGVLYRSESHNDGKKWSPAIPTEIPNPNSAVDISRRGDVVALVYNPVGGNWARRSPLSIAFSDPEGLVFSDPVTIIDGVGNYSYPAMVATNEGFAVSYTWNRKSIACSKVRLGDDGKVVIEPGPAAYNPQY